MSDLARWYVVHTYSGYENKVATNLEKIVENRKLHDWIHEIRVPTETVVEIKDNKKREVERKIFPGYVLVKMVMTDDSWYVVRNTRGVTGFVGPDGQPVALTPSEVEMMLNPQSVGTACDLAIGESVKIVSGSYANFKGTVVEIDQMLGKVLVNVQMFANRTGEVWFNMEDVRKDEDEE